MTSYTSSILGICRERGRFLKVICSSKSQSSLYYPYPYPIYVKLTSKEHEKCQKDIKNIRRTYCGQFEKRHLWHLQCVVDRGTNWPSETSPKEEKASNNEFSSTDHDSPSKPRNHHHRQTTAHSTILTTAQQGQTLTADEEFRIRGSWRRRAEAPPPVEGGRSCGRSSSCKGNKQPVHDRRRWQRWAGRNPTSVSVHIRSSACVWANFHTYPRGFIGTMGSAYLWTGSNRPDPTQPHSTRHLRALVFTVRLFLLLSSPLLAESKYSVYNIKNLLYKFLLNFEIYKILMIFNNRLYM